MSIYIRWMFAFRMERPHPSIKALVEKELVSTSAAACERIGFKEKNRIDSHADFGLLVNPKYIYRNFDYDCWSEKISNRTKLVATRSRYHAPSKDNYFWHTESWLTRNGQPDWVTGIVVQQAWFNLAGNIRSQLRELSLKYKLPVFYLKKGKRLEKVSV